MWLELLQLLLVCSLLAGALLWIEALIRYRQDYRNWNSGICPETGEEWDVTFLDGRKVELKSGEIRRLLTGWILPFEQEEC